MSSSAANDTSLRVTVTFVLDALWVGGAERSLVEVIPALTELGISSEIVCLKHRDENLEHLLDQDATPVHHLDGSGTWRDRRRLRELLEKLSPTIVHSSLTTANLLTRFASVRAPFLVINSLTNTSYEPVRLADPRIRRSRLRAVQALDAVTGRLLVDHFHAVSEEVARSARRHLRIPASKITVVERGRSRERLGLPGGQRRRSARAALGHAREEFLIVTTGRHEYQKNHATLIEAFGRAALGPRVKLLIAGRRGASTTSLQSQIQNLGLAESVQLLGHRDDVPELLAAADVFVFPSLYEGLPGALVEAMAMRLPCIVSDIPPHRDIIEHGHNGLVVAPRSAADLADTLTRLIGSEDERQMLANAALSTFEERFRLERYAREMASFYRERLAAHHRA